MLDLVMRPQAKRDLMSAIIYIGEVLDSPKAAKKLYEDYLAEMDLVRETPDMGAPYRDATLENSGYRWVMVGKYRVFYRHDSASVTVWRIIHCSQDIDEFEMIDWVE